MPQLPSLSLFSIRAMQCMHPPPLPLANAFRIAGRTTQLSRIHQSRRRRRLDHCWRFMRRSAAGGCISSSSHPVTPRTTHVSARRVVPIGSCINVLVIRVSQICLPNTARVVFVSSCVLREKVLCRDVHGAAGRTKKKGSTTSLARHSRHSSSSSSSSPFTIIISWCHLRAQSVGGAECQNKWQRIVCWQSPLLHQHHFIPWLRSLSTIVWASVLNSWISLRSPQS